MQKASKLLDKTWTAWHDRELRFDLLLKDLKPRLGEVEIDSINSVEDTKGNNGHRGFLVITNLRIIWVSHRNPRVNLSVGLNCVSKLSIKTARSRLRGNIKALFVLCTFRKAKYEFIFTSLVRKSPRLFTTIQAVFRSYETTRLYRDLKLRGALIGHDKQLIILPNESVYSSRPGIWNLSTDQGNLGTMFTTNVRIVWHANLAPNFNVSIPYLQIESVRIRKSKFGRALVIRTWEAGGGYILGFRADPQSMLEELFQEIKTIRAVFASKPIFGVNFKVEEKPQALEELRVARVEDDIRIVDDEENVGVNVGGYYVADASNKTDEEGDGGPVFDSSLGLCIEPIYDGNTTTTLWQMYSN